MKNQSSHPSTRRWPTNKNRCSRNAASASRAMLAMFLATTSGVMVAQADSPTETFEATKTSLFKNTGYTPSTTPGANVTSIVDSNDSGTGGVAAPIGWNVNTNSGSGSANDFGDLDITSGASDLVIGDYTTQTSGATLTEAVGVNLEGSTLNSQANTVLANSSGTPVVLQNDVSPGNGSGDSTAETGLCSYILGNSSNYIQATASSNIIIDTVLTGAGDSVTFLGGGNSTTTGATLELGAGSGNDVTGGNAPNAPAPANGGSFTSTAVVQTADQNGFTGGLTIGDTNGTANAGVVQIDGAHALPTSGTVTVNPNSQLFLNGSATYGGTYQTLILNGTGTAATSGALTTHSGDSSTWAGTIDVATNSAINVQGAGTLVVTGTLAGSGQLQTTGAGSLILNGNDFYYSGGMEVSAGNLEAGYEYALGEGPIKVAGGTLSATVTTAIIGGSLSISSGVIQTLAQSAATFSLGSGQDFTMSGGTLDVSDSSGEFGSLSSAGGGSDFSITNGVLNLGGNTWNYSDSYDILSGFGSGSVSGLSITDYDTTDYTASVSSAGVLSFTANAVPEPSTWATMLCGLGALLGFQSRRNRSNRSVKA